MQLWQHQKDCIEKAKKHSYYALFFDAGTGKTATLIHILKEKHKLERPDSVFTTVILCPIVVINNWKREFLLWEGAREEEIFLLTGSAEKKIKVLREAGRQRRRVIVTNYETLLRQDVMMLLKTYMGGHVSALVLDESHRCKTHNSKRTKHAQILSSLAKYRYLLTGTPVLNTLEDLFAQFKILDQGKRLGANYYAFKNMYFEDKNIFMDRAHHFPNWKPRFGAEKRIKGLISDVSFYVDKLSCLSLPPLVKKVIDVEMSAEQKRIYNEMKKDLIAHFDTGNQRVHSIAETALTKALRLQQIVSGFVRADTCDQVTETFTIKSSTRKEVLQEVLQDIVPQHKVIVWAVFHANYEDIRQVCKSLKVKYAELHGQVSNKQEQIDLFTKDKDVRVLIGHPGSGGIGVNLIEASFMVYYSRSFSLEYEVQSEARNYRGGSEIHDKITRIDLVTKGTIDELVFKALEKKQELSEFLLKEHLKEL